MRRVAVPSGTFTVTEDISRYTKAAVFVPGIETEVVLRFSTVAGERAAFRVSWRDMNGYSSHNPMWITAEGARFCVKYHFKCDQGIECS